MVSSADAHEVPWQALRAPCPANRLPGCTHTGGIGDGGKGGVVGGQHGDFFAACAHFQQARQAQGLRAPACEEGGSVP